METFLGTDLSLLGIVLAGMTLLWLVSLARRDASIVDVFWGLGFVLVAALALFLGVPAARQFLLMGMVAAWGIRLAFHLYRRNRGRGEDFRYGAMRARYGSRFPLVSLFIVFGLQGLLLWIIAQPLILVMAGSSHPNWTPWDGLAVVLWGFGFAFEVVADEQLRRFREDPGLRGQVLCTGLWGWSRHPNYFGEAVLWWGTFMLALNVPGRWMTVFSPILMTFLLVRVSGVAMLERSLVERKPGYAEYVRETSAFVPRRPRGSRGLPPAAGR
jgi:steroid 5-alpha reductase family enzyme